MHVHKCFYGMTYCLPMNMLAILLPLQQEVTYWASNSCTMRKFEGILGSPSEFFVHCNHKRPWRHGLLTVPVGDRLHSEFLFGLHAGEPFRTICFSRSNRIALSYFSVETESFAVHRSAAMAVGSVFQALA